MKTSAYRYGKYPFKEFNPVQSQVLPLVDKDTHLIVASPTASGKTIAAELVAGRYALQGLGKIVYLSPLKALAEERMRDWSDSKHPWQGLRKILLTGDYRLTQKRTKELEKADVVIATYEMMAVRCRNQGEEGNWLSTVSCLIVDEAHFLSSSGRGDHLEHALILFTKLYPAARIVFLSATMKNAKEIAVWLKELLKCEQANLPAIASFDAHGAHYTTATPASVTVIESDYRPCQLSIHFVPYEVQRGLVYGARYAAEEEAKVMEVLKLVKTHLYDQWLIFAHAKSAGRAMLEKLSQQGISAAFHNADLGIEDRSAMEERFQNGRIQVLVATSTLAYGLNLPARRVAILGVTRGFVEVDPLDVIQECGRAGRPRYDKEGDAYIVLPYKALPDWKKYLQEGVNVQSVLGRHIGFHLIGEIAEKRVKTKEDALHWASRTLARAQGILPDKGIEEILDLYRSEKLIHGDSFLEAGEEEHSFEATALGVIASKNYYDPLDVAAWKKNLWALHERRLEKSDIALAWAIASVPSHVNGFIPKNLKILASEYLAQLRNASLRIYSDGALALATILDLHLRGETALTQPHRAIFWSLIQDAERLTGCLSQIDTRIHQREEASEYWKMAFLRLLYGVGWEQAILCQIPGIGRAYSRTLIDCGIQSIKDLLKKRETVREVLPEKTFEKVMEHLEGDEWTKALSKQSH